MPLTNNQIKTLLQATLRRDPQDVRNTFATVARQFSAAKSNDALKLWLKETGEQVASQLDLGDRLPNRGGTLTSPANPVKSGVKLSDLRLPPSILAAVNLVIAERCNIESLRRHNLAPTRSMLLHGPSGTGKTSIAKAIAHELDIALRREDAAELVGIHMGDGARNVSRMFNEIKTKECLLLLDECDVLLMQRATRSSLSREENSITAQFLQGMDELPDSCLVIGTTNHTEFIDSAMFRRFQHVIEIGLPTKSEIIRHALSLAKKYKIPEDLLSLGDFGHSYATCVLEVEKLARAWVLSR